MQHDIEKGDTLSITDDSSVTSALEQYMESSGSFLKIEASGIVGFFERMPLWLKLLLITMLAALIILGLAGWLIGVEAQKIMSAAAHKQYSHNYLAIAKFANFVQRERGDAVLYVSIPTELNLNNYKETFANVDLQYAQFSTIAWFNQSTAPDHGKEFGRIRESVITRTADIHQVYQWYSDYSDQLLQLIEEKTQEQGNQEQYVCGEGLFLSLRSTAGMLRSIASIAFTNNNATLSIQYQETFKKLIERRNTQIQSWRATSIKQHIDFVHKNIWSIPEYETVLKMEQRALGALGAQFSSSVDVLEWTGNKTVVLEAYEAALLTFLAQDNNESTQKFSSATLNILEICGCVLLFTIVYGLISFCFSRTIIGPWVRMNKLQESVTNKFVPRGFLRMIGCESITQVQIGKHSTRALVVMKICIRDHWQQIKQMNIENRILYTNRFFDIINPILSNFGGYIDTLSADELQVCFKNANAALSCAKKIHQQVKMMNMSDFAPLNVTIAIHAAANADLAIVGNQERIQGVLVSQLAREVRQVATIATRFQCKTVISNNLVELLTEKLEDTNLIAMVGGNTNFVLYELSSGLNKSEKERFSKAVRDVFVEHNMVDALNYFRTNNTEAAKFYTRVCLQVLDLCRSELTDVNVETILKEPSLEEIMEQACIREQSLENLTIYNYIRQYKEAHQAQDLKKKQEYGRAIEEHMEHANIRDTEKQLVLQALKDPLEMWNESMFNSLESEMLGLLTDTFKRLKLSETFRRAYIKCKGMRSELLEERFDCYH